MSRAYSRYGDSGDSNETEDFPDEFGHPAAVNESEKRATLPEAVEKGGICKIREVYHVPSEGDPDRFQWVDIKPLDADAASRFKTKKERETYAIVLYQKYHDQENEWKISEIQINTPKLQPCLEKVLEGFPGLTQHELKLFSPPYLPFFHRWNAFVEYVDAESDPKTKEYLELLWNILTPELEDTFRRRQQAQKTGHVAFSDLNLMFDPGDLAFRSSCGFRAAGIIRSATKQFDRQLQMYYFSVNVDVVDWDGRRCGMLAQCWRIWEYHGLRALTALDVSPLRDHPDKEEISASLIQRGRTFEKLRGQFFLAFTDEHNERVNERTIIDARAYHKYSNCPHDPFPAFANLAEMSRLTWAQSMSRYSSNPQNETEAPMEVDLAPLTDKQCLLAVPTVKCYNIETKKWAELDLLKFHEIPWSERAFDSLVLDSEEKDLLLALVDRDEFKQSQPFDDFISGKGQGMIMLLSGPPGVGKTLTAESVAEHLRRPLYKLGAGDLGISARSVEACLDVALELCSHWGAVLLIDEADVFMEARTSNDLGRNELVSVFLRHLEYYSGIMILTTNRMRSIDTAFESRIDITLKYNPLTEADRRQVWKNFLRNFDPADIDVDEAAVDDLAKWDFNGRQIKSAIKTARILAAKTKVPLNAKHLSVVLNLRKKALGSMAGDAEVKDAKANGFK
ncbi:P-loop containing nucleoside triphosphate hydrolase protein [Melanomma pulvis-pyrius CBS 109.77]|uniref:P-loop containing nucleoside triphosphate hydrolase protein n=1 Tax=Melanomma pulvis-pyrius CBS 109.77 TaxID=1314802 RepID=A0A6A6XHE3_9PLEO|nr:P-loop containing nucleoside triphosphate hydrolase protein [Melanomma pulvis-pyrius CBS 109.77]